MKKVKSMFKRYWKDTDRVGFMEDGYFTNWLEQLDSHVEVIIVNGESKKVVDFKKEFFDNKDFLYVTNSRCNHNDNSIIVKDNLDREFYIQDIEMLDKTVELVDCDEWIEINDAPLEADEIPL